MIQVTPQMRILVALETADFSKVIDGLARLCKEQLELANSLPYGWVDGAIERTAKHLDSVFDVQHNKGDHGGGSYHFYYLYSVERVGDLTGRKEFGGKDWYVRGAEFLLAQQHAGGAGFGAFEAKRGCVQFV